MNYQVFVSFSSADIKKVRKILAELSRIGIDVFCSDKDIKPGESFDKTIQDAIDYSSYIVVFASKRSVKSEYVKSEVEYALSNNKTVIPVLLEEVSLPLRWHRLQYIKSEGDIEKIVAGLKKVLPSRDILQFKAYLDTTVATANGELRKLILRNPHWMLSPYSSAASIEINEFDELKGLDYFHAYADSGGLRAQFFVLLSADAHPFLSDGKTTKELKNAVSACKRTIKTLIKLKHPNELLEVAAYRAHYSYFDVSIVAGRNIHYPPSILRKRKQITWDFIKPYGFGTTFKLISYDWLYVNAYNLERAIKNGDNSYTETTGDDWTMYSLHSDKPA